MGKLFQKGRFIYQKIMTQIRGKEGVQEDIQAQDHYKPRKANNTKSRQSDECHNISESKLDGIIMDLSEKVLKMHLDLDNKLDQVIYTLDDCKKSHRLDKSFLGILQFIQHLDRYLFDATLNPDFVDKVRQDVRNVLSLYGYKIVDFDKALEESSNNRHYDIEFIDSDFMPDFELVFRAIVDMEDNTTIKGKVYIKRNI